MANAALHTALKRILGAGTSPTREDVKGAILGELESHAQDPKLATWMLSKLARAGRPLAALELLDVLQGQRLQLNVYHSSSAACWLSYKIVCTPCTNCLREGRALARGRYSGRGYAAKGFGATISACEKLGLWVQALDVVRYMNKFTGILPDAISFSALISACEKGCEWSNAVAFLLHMASSKVEPNTLSYSGAVSACEKSSGSLWRVALGLSSVMDRDVVSHSASISACEKAAKWTIALELLLLMPLLRLFPNLVPWCTEGPRMLAASSVTYNAALSACDRQSQWRSLILLLEALISKDLKPDLLSYLAADGGLQRSVLIDDWRAEQIQFNGFNAAFSACRGQPCAKLLFDDMGRQHLQPDMTTYAALQISYGKFEVPSMLTSMEEWQLQLLQDAFKMIAIPHKDAQKR
eukprot:s205_g31.t2